MISFYDMHGVGLEVESGEDLNRALDRRLRGFAAPGADADVLLRFSADGGAAPGDPGRTVYETRHGSVLYHEGSDVLTADFGGVRLRADMAAGSADVCCDDFRGERGYVAAHPLMTLALMELLERRGRYALHAGCVARDGRAAVIAGTSGAGKSTLALSCIRAGLDFLSDDTMFLAPDCEGVTAYGFPDAVGVSDLTRRWVPELEADVKDPGFPKHLVRPEEALGATVVASAVPVAVVFPRIVPGRESRLERIAPGDAWLRLMPDVLLTHPTYTQRHIAAIAALTEQAECYELHSSLDLAGSARLVEGLL